MVNFFRFYIEKFADIYSFYYSYSTLQLLYSFYYSYSTLQLLYSRSAASTHTPATRPSTRRTTSHNGPAHLARTHTHTHTHTHTGFFFKGFLPLDTGEPRISFSPNHISHSFCIVWNISWHIWRGEGEPIQYMALSLSLLIGSITILATTLFQGRAMAPSMLCKPFLPIVRQ